MKHLNLKKIKRVVVSGIDINDFPDFTMSFIESGEYECKQLTKEQLDFINNKCTDYVQMQVMKKQTQDINNYFVEC